MSNRNAGLAFLWLFWVVPALAVECEQAKPDAGQAAHIFLRDYGKECISRQVESQLERWKIGPANTDPKRDEGNLSQSVGAWKDIADALGKLANETPGKIGDVTPQMKNVDNVLSQRADIARSSLALALQQQASPDIAAFQSDAWELPPQMFLRSYDRPGEPFLPLVSIASPLDADCGDVNSALCAETIKRGRELMFQLKLAERIAKLASASTIRELSKQIAKKDELWNKYLYDSKPMLPFDFFLTDLMEGRWGKSDNYPDGFPVPPKTQWFLLHPSVGVEYASAAADGQQLKPILYLEVLGVNRWNEADRIPVPGLRYFSGFSVIVSYADRAGVKDTGYGALFTFDNVYSIGVTRYGSEKGVFLSLDLANLYRDKLK